VPRDGAIIFGDLIGTLDMKCSSGRYQLADLIRSYGRSEKLFGRDLQPREQAIAQRQRSGPEGLATIIGPGFWLL
jgi:hypothetical protein